MNFSSYLKIKKKCISQSKRDSIDVIASSVIFFRAIIFKNVFQPLTSGDTRVHFNNLNIKYRLRASDER